MMPFEWQWIAAIGVPLLIGGITMWWKVEAGQDKKLDRLHDENHKAHLLLHQKIDKAEEVRDDQHLSLRDKIEEIWKHVVKHK